MSTTSTQTPPPAHFTNPQKKFLEKVLPEFCAFATGLGGTGPRQLQGVKGKQKEWVKGHVLKTFVDEFSEHKENNDVLFNRIYKWLQNGKMRLGNKTVIRIKEVPAPARPRAKTARQCFGNAFRAKINEQVKAEREETGASSKDNLQIYYRIRDNMYNAADEETRTKYEEEAKSFNAKAHGPPDESVIYSSQEDIAENTAVALKGLCGWDWGGHGNTVFFVLGAYQNENEDLVPFSSTVASALHPVDSFRTRIPDFQQELWDRFLGFASSVLHLKDEHITTTASTPSTVESFASERDAHEHATAIPDLPQADRNINGDSETVVGMLDGFDSDGDTRKVFDPKTSTANPLQHNSPVPSSIPANPPQQLCLTDEQMAFVIASALSAVPKSDGPMVTQEQEQPPKVQRKRHAKQAVVKVAQPSTVSSPRPVKRKRQEHAPPTVELPTKKAKTPALEPGKRVSARLHADGYKNKHINVR